MGIKRRLDYILASKCFFVQESGASEILNSGSDHRAVLSILVSQTRKKGKYRKKDQMKGWRPRLDFLGNASWYHEALREKLSQNHCPTIANVEKVLYEAATCPGVRVEVVDALKPWQSEEVQDLSKRRRLSTSPVERMGLSKNIKKKTRGLLRKYKNKKVAEMLDDFSGLDRLQQIQEYPIAGKNNGVGIKCDVFAKNTPANLRKPRRLH